MRTRLSPARAGSSRGRFRWRYTEPRDGQESEAATASASFAPARDLRPGDARRLERSVQVAGGIEKLLVANRGEIALRVFRACRELGIATVAVVAPDDRGRLHERSADEAVEISSYLEAEEQVRAARETGADAIHPGYGFLAESPEFAEAVEAAGLVWVGPPAEALRAGGDKLEAKRIAREAGVPVVPDGEPAEIGFPLMIKAAAGGGGRGMRVVRSADELDEALAAARREAKAAFGDDRVFSERYVERPRHVEIQLLGDATGNVVALGGRECSVQRRHQKVLEEAPSPALDGRLREQMSEAAVSFARAIGYRSAGTAEFMLDGRDFWFLELNGRIQVEHPVTELVTGVDLVKEQLRIAHSEPMQVTDCYLAGHAVETRLYAEDPRTFLPQAGRIERLRLPSDIRVDAGVEEGDEVGTTYDPMIAKLIAHGDTREQALNRLAAALDETEVEGVTTNLPFLRWLVAHPALRAGRTTTAFLTEYPPLSAPPLRVADHAWSGAFRLNLPTPAPAAPPDPDTASHDGAAGAEQSTLTAPMPGTVIRLLVREGDKVQPRQPLVVLEAMKMETPIVSPYEAVVRAVHVSEGDRVAGGELLVELEE
jgi:acetyl/propionyl-CoA carboxylase alpha subunit